MKNIIGLILVTPIIWYAGATFSNYKLRQGNKSRKTWSIVFTLALWGLAMLGGFI